MQEPYLPPTAEAAEASGLVFLRFELTPDRSRLMKWEWRTLWGSTWAAVGLLIGLSIADKDRRTFKRGYYIFNVVRCRFREA